MQKIKNDLKLNITNSHSPIPKELVKKLMLINCLQKKYELILFVAKYMISLFFALLAFILVFFLFQWYLEEGFDKLDIWINLGYLIQYLLIIILYAIFAILDCFVKKDDSSIISINLGLSLNLILLYKIFLIRNCSWRFHSCQKKITISDFLIK